ncbi:MAG: recombination protein O N-terminal domain-containing protein [Candidatus Gracilibacteria bacterium]|nr:recombination protein O N-terminal domain-containing protein [Candidatus Gracilibacteria bacterium]MDD3120320.1 recombination protein O N-terminal domain-containing protein [Candidatus Gracilibacteria bacterium]MDD4530845.1 recombination protein O N-terminal domain-containing protein [Candidatus Gracilibacteria bacterium]
MFNTNGIILKKNKINEKQIVFTVFSEDYGKVSVWIDEIKRSPIDIGSTLNLIINRKNGTNRSNNYKLKRGILYTSLSYIGIENILNLLKFLNDTLPEGIEKDFLFKDYEKMLNYFCDINKNPVAIEIFKLKIIKKLGFYQDPKVLGFSDNFIKIYNAIDLLDLEKIININGIEKIQEELEDYNEQNLKLILN